MTTRPTPLDPAFARLSAMVSEFGDDFQPMRHNLDELLQDTRDALNAPTRRATMRMSA